MYLKRIETIGFKSFADKTTVQFEPGVTAVVGPNGSGKSNISDAVRWVLGEQSAKSLRGGKMEDIIFAGTQTRKALNYAEVTLVLDNSCQTLPLDFDEIGVTRRVFRTGESEYLINRQKVRLKDVVDLMMDTGIGHDSLSMISQDRVKAIVESKVDERRVIIEEAAGVLKYKMRKKEAGRKLQSTVDNLSRVYDIIYELEDQIEPLKKQAKTAQAYQELRGKMSSSELAMLGYEITRLNTQALATRSQNQEAQIELLAINQKSAADDALRQSLKDVLIKKEKDLASCQEKLVETSELIQKLSGQRDVLAERQKNATTNKEELRRQQESLKAALQLAQKSFKEAGEATKKTEGQIQKTRADLEASESKYQHLEADLQTQHEEAKSAFYSFQNQLVQVKDLYQTVLGQVDKAETSLEQTRVDITGTAGEKLALAEETATFFEKFERMEEELKERRQNYKAAFSKTKELEENHSRAKNEWVALTHQVDKTQGRLHWLEEAQKDFSGFNEGVKKILQAKEHNKVPGIVGAIAQLVDIPKELETAMDVILGPMMQQIVTQTDKDAQQAIRYLKDKRAGRATFLPLNVIKPRMLPEQIQRQVEQEIGVVGVAAKLVDYESKYSHIFGNLLGSIVVTKDLASANRLAKTLAYRYRIVTLEGDVVNTGGSMTGGAVKRQGSSLLRQKNELEDIRQRLDQQILDKEALEVQVAVLQGQLQEQKSIEEKLLASGDRLKERLGKLNGEKVAYEYKARSLDERLRLLQSQKEILKKEAQELAKKLNSLAEKRVALEAGILEKEGIMANLELQIGQQEQLKAGLLQGITDKKIELARLETQLEGRELDQDRYYAELGSVRGRLDEISERINSSDGTLVGNDGEIERLGVEVSALRVKREEILEQIQVDRANQSKTTLELEQTELSLREGRRHAQALSETVHKNEVALGKIDVEMDALLKRIETDYQMTYDFVVQNYPLKEAVQDAQKKIMAYKKEIEALGEVNTGAIAEYGRVRERYDFLVAQQDDLLIAKENLEETINEMDVEMAAKFKETFDQVRVHYIEIFKKLFGGGNADLILTDPDDLLGTGVEIIAQPPGTKLKTSNLLSGGQKALTSIALLFGILKVRSVPFCILDEVEAALDEANVSRYATYLKAFSQDTQFIVITHRKGTMEKADVLYGVTMQERGVTKLVSVRMDTVGGYLDEEIA
ncbi:MAG: chromosome segregation protein SMC [Turicibacter sp.]|nr:chromosome segregation protein SMC [Turicibacter sp.]